MVLVRHRYAYENRPNVSTSFEVKKDSKGRVLNPGVISMTNQADADACDLVKMFARFEKTGVLIDDVSGLTRAPVYGDFSQIGDFHDMKCRLAAAQQAFDCLPAATRNRFDNDPGKLLEFLADSKNDREAVKLKLKDEDVLRTAFADDGKTRIYPEERAELDRVKAAKEAAAAAAGAAGASGTGTGEKPAGV